MNFRECFTRVQRFVNDDSAATLLVIKETIGLKIHEILQSGFWQFAIRDTTVSTTSGTADYFLPTDLDRIVDIRQTTCRLSPVWIEAFDLVRPNPTTPGLPTSYMLIDEVGVLAQPTVSAKVVMYSTSNQDIAALTGATMVSIYGTSGGVDKIENKMLSATNVLSSTNAFTKIYAIDSDIAPAGTLRFTENTVGTTLLELFSGELGRAHQKIKLYPTPDAAYTIYVRYQARQVKLKNDSDPLLIPDRFSDAVTEMVIAELMLKQGDDKAPMHLTLAMKALDRMRKEQDMFYDMTPTIRTTDVSYVNSDIF